MTYESSIIDLGFKVFKLFANINQFFFSNSLFTLEDKLVKNYFENIRIQTSSQIFVFLTTLKFFFFIFKHFKFHGFKSIESQLQQIVS
jgi:hypothetical protein